MDIFSSESIQIATAVRNHLNSWIKKPCDFELETISKDPPALMIQQLGGAQIVKRYINGSYIGVWNFAVYIRIPGIDTNERIDASACLNELAEWLTRRDANGKFDNLPILYNSRIATQIELTSAPSIATRQEDGTEDYQAIFSLEYKYKYRRN